MNFILAIQPIEIIVIVIAFAIVFGVIGNYIYRKIKKLPTGECAHCSKGKSLVKDYYKLHKVQKEHNNKK